MPVIHRRVFYGKVGTADQLVAHLREGDRMLQGYGANFKTRLLTDHMTGRSDRVVAEWEADNVGEFESAVNRAMTNPQAQADMGPWMEKLGSLIDYAEGDNWLVR